MKIKTLTSECTGKEAMTKGEARAASSRMNANRYNKKGLPPVRTYKCARCGMWHLGNPSKRVNK